MLNNLLFPLSMHDNYNNNIKYFPLNMQDSSGVPRGGVEGFKPPPPRNSEGPPKSCQTQTDCENC